MNQRLAIRLLEKQGHTVVVVGDGQAAVDAVAQQPFDVVLMDPQMPGLDGLAATAAIRVHEQTTGAHVPILALTAHAMKGDAERCLAVGMDGYVTKPIKADTLMAALDGLLGSTMSPAPPLSAPPVDLAQALHGADNDKDVLEEVVQVFLADAPACFDKLRTAISLGEARQTESTAHALKGALGAVGATTAHALAVELETMARTGELEGAMATLHHLDDELQRLFAFFAEPGWLNCIEGH